MDGLWIKNNGWINNEWMKEETGINYKQWSE